MSELSETPDELIDLLTSWAIDFCPADAVNRYDEAGLEAHLRKVLLPRLVAAEADRERLREACEKLQEACQEFVDHYPRGINPWLDEARLKAITALNAARAALKAE